MFQDDFRRSELKKHDALKQIPITMIDPNNVDKKVQVTYQFYCPQDADEISDPWDPSCGVSLASLSDSNSLNKFG